jgi:hypothetical protein
MYTFNNRIVDFDAKGQTGRGTIHALDVEWKNTVVLTVTYGLLDELNGHTCIDQVKEYYRSKNNSNDN